MGIPPRACFSKVTYYGYDGNENSLKLQLQSEKILCESRSSIENLGMFGIKSQMDFIPIFKNLKFLTLDTENIPEFNEVILRKCPNLEHLFIKEGEEVNFPEIDLLCFKQLQLLSIETD